MELIVGILFSHALRLDLWQLQPVITYTIMGLTVSFTICVVFEFFVDYNLILATREVNIFSKIKRKLNHQMLLIESL